MSAIQGEESKIDLESAEAKLKVQEAAVNLHQKSDEAKIASLTRLRDKAQVEVDLARERLGQMEIKTPIAEGSNSADETSSQGWMNRQPFKVGDHVQSNALWRKSPTRKRCVWRGDSEECGSRPCRGGQRRAGTRGCITRSRQWRRSWPACRRLPR